MFKRAVNWTKGLGLEDRGGERVGDDRDLFREGLGFCCGVRKGLREVAFSGLGNGFKSGCWVALIGVREELMVRW